MWLPRTLDASSPCSAVAGSAGGAALGASRPAPALRHDPVRLRLHPGAVLQSTAIVSSHACRPDVGIPLVSVPATSALPAAIHFQIIPALPQRRSWPLNYLVQRSRQARPDRK